MGTWGPGLFSDDTACDVRDEYRDLVGDGSSGPEATDRLIAGWQDELDDPDSSPVFWLALAVTQSKCGRLEERVSRRALEVIDNGTDLARWQHDSGLVKKRAAVLNRVRQKLESPQPAEKRIPKRFRNHCEWAVGDVLAYRLLSGRLVLFRVIGYHSDRGGTSPVVEVLDWEGETPPRPRRLKRMNYRIGVGEWQRVTQLMIGRLSENELPVDRVTLIAARTRPRQNSAGFVVTLWSYLDRQLLELYGLE